MKPSRDNSWLDVTYFVAFLVVTGCVSLSDPPNGEVTVTGITIGSEAIYRCDRGYNLVGSETRRCIESDTGMGMWTDTEPQCIGMRM